MNSSFYKYCIVPECNSTTKKTPNKLFIYVPHNKQKRRKWLKMARRQDALTLSTDSTIYFCEDHFDLPNDMENYMRYHVMGSISQVRMKPGCVPTRFECQQLPTTTEPTKKKQKQMPKTDIEEDTCNITPSEQVAGTSLESSDAETFPEDDVVKMEEEVPRVCRVCLASGVRMYELTASGLQDTFEHVSGTELHTADERPRQACFACCSQLQRFRAFCQMSQKAETYMTKLLKEGRQITEQEVSKCHQSIEPKLVVSKIPFIAIHTTEDPSECADVKVKEEVKDEVEAVNKSDSETESETEIATEVKTGTDISETENETEERIPDMETEAEIEIDEIKIEEFDPFEALENTTKRDETCYCAEAFPSQRELLKHDENHTQKKYKQATSPKQDVKAKKPKRNSKTKVQSKCNICNKTFAIKTQLVTHWATEHGFG